MPVAFFISKLVPVFLFLTQDRYKGNLDNLFCWLKHALYSPLLRLSPPKNKRVQFRVTASLCVHSRSGDGFSWQTGRNLVWEVKQCTGGKLSAAVRF